MIFESRIAITGWQGGLRIEISWVLPLDPPLFDASVAIEFGVKRCTLAEELK